MYAGQGKGRDRKAEEEWRVKVLEPELRRIMKARKTPIPIAKEYKYLGVLIQGSLEWETCLKRTLKKMSDIGIRTSRALSKVENFNFTRLIFITRHLYPILAFLPVTRYENAVTHGKIFGELYSAIKANLNISDFIPNYEIDTLLGMSLYEVYEWVGLL